MTYTTKRKLKFGTAMGFMIVACVLCLVPIFSANPSGMLGDNTMIAYGILACVILNIVSQIAFGYVPPDPKDALDFAQGAVVRTRDELVEIRLKQIETEMRLRGDTKRSRNNWLKKCRPILQELSIVEMVKQIGDNTPTYK